LVAVRRRCSFGEIVEEEDEEKRATTDGFDPTKSNQNIQNGTSSRNITGSQVVASRSVLGINIATDPRRRSKSRTLEEQEKVKHDNKKCYNLNSWISFDHLDQFVLTKSI